MKRDQAEADSGISLFDESSLSLNRLKTCPARLMALYLCRIQRFFFALIFSEGSRVGGSSKAAKAELAARRKAQVAVAKDILAQKKAEHAARSKGFVWTELDGKNCDDDVDPEDTDVVMNGKESLAKELCTEKGEVRL